MGIGPWELVLILAIVLVIFGAKRLKTIGSDLGNAIKSFKQSMKDEDDKLKPDANDAPQTPPPSNPSEKKH